MGGGHLLVPKSADVTVDTSTSSSSGTTTIAAENNNNNNQQEENPLDQHQDLTTNHQNLSYSSEFYASLPRNHQQKSLLCCVCHEHNTTFRYEVVYKNSLQEASAPALGHQPNSKTKTTRAVANNSGPKKNGSTSTNLILHNNPSTLTDLVRQQVTLTTSVDTTDDTDDSNNHEYYNFPPRHPRHGHLKWSVWRPALAPLTSSSSSAAASPTNIYPFPVTTTGFDANDNNNSQKSVVHESICITTYPDYPVHLSTFTLKRVASVIKQNKGRQKLSTYLGSQF